MQAFGNWINMTDKTLNYYNKNAQTFADGTVSVEFTEMQDKFLKKLNPGAHILDFGCFYILYLFLWFVTLPHPSPP